MSKTMLRISLSELTTARVTCKKCQRGVIEVPIARLDAALDKGTCRLCGADILSQPDPLHRLRAAIEDLNGRAAELGVEFEIPDPR